MFLLDTNICIAVINGDRQAVSVFNQMFPQCYTSTIVIAELYKDVRLSRLVEQNLRALNQFADLIDVEPFGINAAAEFGAIQQELRRQGRVTGKMDVLIAAVARSRGDVLVTNNTRDFIHIPNLRNEHPRCKQTGYHFEIARTLRGSNFSTAPKMLWVTDAASCGEYNPK